MIKKMFINLCIINLKPKIMKKLFVVAAVALIVVSFSSCKKDYTCTCKGDTMGSIVLPFNDAKKADAQDACDAAETTYKNADATCTCTLD